MIAVTFGWRWDRLMIASNIRLTGNEMYIERDNSVVISSLRARKREGKRGKDNCEKHLDSSR